MQKNYFVVGPSALCPFYVEALKYTPARSMVNGYTLVLLHGSNLHKETFDSFVSALLEDSQTSSLPIQDVWSIDSPNSGRSSSLNQALLSTSEYESNWNAFEYARAAHSFLYSDNHKVDFRSRKLIGVAHSAGSTSLILLHQMKPPSAFHGLILFEPVICPNEHTSFLIRSMFGQWARKKKDSWPSRACARKELLKHPAYMRWDPNLVELFVTCGLRETGDEGRVTLACSKHHEQAYYSMSSNFVGPPTNVFENICQEGKIPIHLFLAEDAEYKGKTYEPKWFQVENVKRTPHGSTTWMKGGHMLPQVVPKVLAEKVAQVLLDIAAREECLAKL